MLNGAKFFQTSIEKVKNFDANLQCHIDLLESAITEATGPTEKEKGRAAIRRLRAGMAGLKK